MGRLDCKEPSLTAFGAHEGADVNDVTVSDAQAEAATVQLSELGIHTTPSGAAGKQRCNNKAFLKKQFLS